MIIHIVYLGLLITYIDCYVCIKINAKNREFYDFI